MQLLLANVPIRLYTGKLFRLTLTGIKVSFRIASNSQQQRLPLRQVALKRDAWLTHQLWTGRRLQEISRGTAVAETGHQRHLVSNSAVSEILESVGWIHCYLLNCESVVLLQDRPSQ